MKVDGTLAYLIYAASIALAAPVEKRAGTSYNGGTTANDVTNGGTTTEQAPPFAVV